MHIIPHFNYANILWSFISHLIRIQRLPSLSSLNITPASIVFINSYPFQNRYADFIVGLVFIKMDTSERSVKNNKNIIMPADVSIGYLNLDWAGGFFYVTGDDWMYLIFCEAHICQFRRLIRQNFIAASAGGIRKNVFFVQRVSLLRFAPLQNFTLTPCWDSFRRNFCIIQGQFNRVNPGPSTVVKLRVKLEAVSI